MMKGKKIWFPVLLVISVFLIQTLTAFESYASKTYHWKMTSFFSAGRPQNDILKKFIGMVEERTNNTITIKLFESTLGQPTDHWDMIKNGVFDLGYIADGYTLGKMPVGCLFNLPFQVTDIGTLYEVYGEWLEAGYLKEITDYFEILFYRPTPFMHLFLKDKKVLTLEDIQKMKIRAIQGMQGKTVSALGASPVSLPGPDTYMSMATGVIDGTITGPDYVMATKLYEVVKYGLKMPVYAGLWIGVVNNEVWRNLPEDLQNIIKKVSREIAQTDRQQAEANDKAAWEDLANKTKVEIYTISPEEQARWKNKTKQIAVDYLEEYSNKGYPVKEAYKMLQDRVNLVH